MAFFLRTKVPPSLPRKDSSFLLLADCKLADIFHNSACVWPCERGSLTHTHTHNSDDNRETAHANTHTGQVKGREAGATFGVTHVDQCVSSQRPQKAKVELHTGFVKDEVNWLEANSRIWCLQANWRSTKFLAP